MKIILERNKKFGRGYQVHLLHGPVDSVMDLEPYTLYDATQGAQVTVDEINKQTGTSYKLHEVLHIDGEAIEANKDTDLASARFARDIQTGKREYVTEEIETRDFCWHEIDGKKELMLSGRGVMLFAWLGWSDEKNAKSRELLRQYCNLLAMRGYGKGASKILEEALRQGKEEGLAWVRETYGKYIRNSNEIMDMMQNMGRG